MRNKFGGNCYRCGKYVKAGDGHFQFVDAAAIATFGSLVRGQKTLVQHASCAIEHRGTNFHYRTHVLPGIQKANETSNAGPTFDLSKVQENVAYTKPTDPIFADVPNRYKDSVDESEIPF